MIWKNTNISLKLVPTKKGKDTVGFSVLCAFPVQKHIQQIQKEGKHSAKSNGNIQSLENNLSAAQ